MEAVDADTNGRASFSEFEAAMLEKINAMVSTT